MKSNLTNLVIAFVLVAFTSFSSELCGQSGANASVSGAENSVTFTFLQSGPSALQSSFYQPTVLALGMEQDVFSTLVDQGFYYDGATNHMYVNTTYDSKYTRIEIIAKASKEHLFDGSLGNAMTATEIRGLKSGTYKFIFTNEAGNIMVDEINVMTISRSNLLLANNDD